MTKRGFVVHEVHADQARGPRHAVIEELESFGFTRLGLLAMRPVDEAAELSRFEGSDREARAQRLKRVRQVMVASDEQSFAVVDVGDTSVLVYFLTLLTTGSLVQTFKLPASRTPLPEILKKRRESFYTRTNSRHRRVNIVDSDSGVGAAQAHQGIVAWSQQKDGGAAVRHASMDLAVTLLQDLLRHDLLVQQRRGRVRSIVRVATWLCAVLVGASIATGLTRSGDSVDRYGAFGGIAVAMTVAVVFALIVGKWEPQLTTAALKLTRARPAFQSTEPKDESSG